MAPVIRRLRASADFPLSVLFNVLIGASPRRAARYVPGKGGDGVLEISAEAGILESRAADPAASSPAAALSSVPWCRGKIHSSGTVSVFAVCDVAGITWTT